MIDDRKFEAMAERLLPSTRTINRILVFAFCATTLLAGYALAGKWRAERRAQADEERLQQMETELAKVVRSADQTSSPGDAAIRSADQRRKELTDLLPKSE